MNSGLKNGVPKENFYDVVVVGGGPAGLTAALYLARACYRVLVVEKEAFGGQVTITEEIVNYPGVSRTSGRELTETMRQQAESFGAEFLLTTVTEAELQDEIKTVHTEKGDFSCFGVLLATGANPKKIGFPGEREFQGRGVAYCATCDGEFFAGKEVFVIGGGFAAAEESVFLTRYASHVTVLVREEAFTCAKAVAQPALEHPDITVLTDTEVVEVTGDHMLRSIRYRNSRTGEETVFAPQDDTFGVFVFAGYTPDTHLVQSLTELDAEGYIRTDSSQKTSIEGVYAAGDVCQKNLRQVVTAVGDGATAATELEKYAQKMQKKTGIKPERPSSDGRTKKTELPQPDSSQFSTEMLGQLQTVFSRMEHPLTLCLHLDNRPVSEELAQYMQELAQLTDKLTVTTAEGGEYLPFVQLLREDGSDTGLSFHGVPGGHEATSFILSLYNAAGPGQPLDPTDRETISKLPTPLTLQILVSLSCAMCPECVISAQRIASLNEEITAQVYDLGCFPELQKKYQIMSVPCVVVNGDKLIFGKKNVPQLLELLK